MNQEYKEAIAELLEDCEDSSLLDLIYQLLYKAQETR
jgi:23S rRNA maturation-related 3'-5' exoribonuclease YhaM